MKLIIFSFLLLLNTQIFGLRKKIHNVIHIIKKILISLSIILFDIKAITFLCIKII